MKKLLIVTLTLTAVLFACKDDKGNDPCNCLSTYGTTAHLGMLTQRCQARESSGVPE